MDPLDRVADPAADLLDRVDAVLAGHGAPADHPVWPLLRQLGVLPGVAVAQFGAFAPDVVRADASPLSALADECRTAVAAVPSAPSTRGLAADGFAHSWSGLSGQITSDVGGLDDRAARTAAYLQDVADWAVDARNSLATRLGACLGSAEAVSVRAAWLAGSDPAGDERAATSAAADIAAHVLSEVAHSIEAGWQVRSKWADVADEVPVRPAGPLDVALPTHIELH
jgi:hypothetical protein